MVVMGEGSYHFVGWDSVHKFGYNPDIDTGTVPEDVHAYATGSIAFPATSTITTVFSDSASDTASGTGAQTITVQGIVADGTESSESVNLNGLASVTLTTAFIGVHRAFVTEAGSGGENAGNVDVAHGSTVLARIGLIAGTGSNQTLQAGYQIPEPYLKGVLTGWSATAGRAAAAYATVCLMIRTPGGVWQTKDVKDVHTDGGMVRVNYPVWQEYDPGTQIKLRVVTVSANNMTVSGSFDLLLVNQFG